MTATLIITVLGDDRPGIIESISTCVSDTGANWTESHFVNFAGKFTGILQVDVSDENREKLTSSLTSLSSHQLSIQVSQGAQPKFTPFELTVQVTAHDRPGIIKEISERLAATSFSIQKLESSTSSAAMSAEGIFKATIFVSHHIGDTDEAKDLLIDCLESLQDDLIVEI